jgi:DNA polymerase III sliding clamp (beta) subunit (PCNA family)
LAVLNCVRFHADGDGLKATATDLDQTLVYGFTGATCEGQGEIIVPYATLKEWPRATPPTPSPWSRMAKTSSSPMSSAATP